jgi:hypothetical protein
VLDRVAALAAQHRLDPQLLRAMYALMIDHAHDTEREIIALTSSGQAGHAA